MRFLGRIFGGKERAEEEQPHASQCPHTSLTPRWDAADDMGKMDKVTRYSCESCGTTFSREEAERRQQTKS